MDALQGRGGAWFVGGGSWIVGAWRWRVASLREGPLRLDLHLEVCAGLGVAFLKATPGLSPSQSEKGLGNLLSRVLLQTAGFARVVDCGSSRGKRWDSDVVVCGALLAEAGTTVVCDSYGAVQLVRSHCLTLRGSGETSQQFPPRRSEETGPQ
ncbi:hypothetical protein Taro_021285 [Colocasia esculenta]|uniref:Uncharacterized protein n=1 Tax=Colocasia esculenta TaxID=4460 RepID=A0A843V210_COLES|nr:hypothetical protein [Colocasia esculenta]